MTEITKQDCENLYNDFMDFCNSVETNFNAYLLFLLLDTKMLQTIKNFENTSQEELRSMFRAILKIMKKDCSKYEEVVN